MLTATDRVRDRTGTPTEGALIQQALERGDRGVISSRESNRYLIRRRRSAMNYGLAPTVDGVDDRRVWRSIDDPREACWSRVHIARRVDGTNLERMAAER